MAFMLSLKFNSVKVEDFTKVTIAEGDSIWEISEQFSEKHGLSNEEFISWVKQHNNIEGDRIYPGEEIIIPVNYHDEIPTELASAAGE